jgi:hypothetical protein
MKLRIQYGKLVGRPWQGDHKGAPLLWTGQASSFVGIVGAMACPRPGWGGRPAGVSIRLSSPDQPMEQLIGINVACPRPACVAPCAAKTISNKPAPYAAPFSLYGLTCNNLASHDVYSKRPNK